jgi:transcriptional regulator with XRE-family HTH domain
MNSRFKQIRLAKGMNQSDFGKLLGITKSGVSDIEAGRRNVTEQHIIMLKNNDINETWLRTGEGEMFVPRDREQELAKLTTDFLLDEPDSFRSRFISLLARMSDEEWRMVENMVDRLTKKE